MKTLRSAFGLPLVASLVLLACSSDPSTENQDERTTGVGGDESGSGGSGQEPGPKEDDPDATGGGAASGGNSASGGSSGGSATGGSASGGDASGGNGSGGSNTGGSSPGSGGATSVQASWSAWLASSGEVYQLLHGGDVALDCEFTDQGLVANFSSPAEIENCSSENSLSLRLPGVFEDTLANISYERVGMQLVEAVHQTQAKGGPGCWGILGREYNSCEFTVSPAGQNSALLSISGYCQAGQQQWEGSVTFDPSACSATLDLGVSSCAGSTSTCSVLDTDICSAFTGCEQGQACSAYTPEQCDSFSEVQCVGKAGCLWNGDYCESGSANTCASQQTADCLSSGCQLLDVCTGNASCSTATDLECLALANCTPQYPL